VGESGSGKTTIVEELQKQYNLKTIQSYTTREKRSQNETGHIFVTDEEFDKLKDICGFTNFNGSRYCATSEQVDSADLYVIDVWGVDYFKEHYKGNKIPRVVYISTTPQMRESRMLKRGDKKQQVLQRLEHDKIAFQGVEKLADLIVVNDNLDKSIKTIWKYINNNEVKI
jgi:guanylate kinase